VNPDLLIRNGTLVGPSSAVPADVVLTAGKVLALVAPGGWDGAPARRVLDASGRLVLPGGVDPHCHVGFTSGAYTSLDEYPEATTAAVFGGTTTIVDFAIPRPGEAPLGAAVRQQALASTGVCDAALHACVVDWDDSLPGQLASLAALGVRTVKMFTTYRGETMASEGTIFSVMRELRGLGGMSIVHCESNPVIEEQQSRCAHAGAIDASHHAETRPEIAETSSVAAVIALAEALGAPVYLVHQSSAACLEVAADARRRGVTVFSESVTHHLVLDDSLYRGSDPERFVCCPPLRSAATVQGLRAGAFDGSISTIGSDHCCYDTVQKRSARHDVRSMPNGLPGVETRLPVVFSELVVRAGLPLERFVALCCTNPARANGLFPRKGLLAPGSDADVVVFDPDARRVVTAGELHMATDYTPYEGLEVTGWPETVIVGGRVVVERGELVDGRPTGRALRAAELAFGDPRVAPLRADIR
jgi:dihydropyrimidinase